MFCLQFNYKIIPPAEPEDNFAVIYNRKMVVGRKSIYKFMPVKIRV